MRITYCTSLYDPDLMFLGRGTINFVCGQGPQAEGGLEEKVANSVARTLDFSGSRWSAKDISCT